MKQLLLLLIPLFFLQKALSQPVVFCPVGAEWHYLFQQGITGILSNERIKYVGDSLLGTDSVKVLKQKWNKYYAVSNFAPGANNLTFIKQKGDTVFFKNYLTQGSWQILYNFATLPGQSWQTTIKTQGTSASSASNTSTYSITVDSISSVTINLFNLKVLHVSSNPNLYYYGNTKITERLGGNAFFYYFMNQSTGSDPDFIYKFLCYQDSTFGLKQFTVLDCYKDDRVGLEEYSAAQPLRIFPNPVTDVVNLEINEPGGEMALRITDISGRELQQMKLETGQSRLTIDLGGLAGGIYLVAVMREKKLIYTGKVVKED